ncbi:MULTISPECIES: hypothetical protein [unclassified Pseudomonas]|uniref:hypothetical protein n=1 Tax=unclassified Pseudomonas TaxID=196821 RepID=UPI0016568F1F|nr:hypothetical protein [Pseudomonas sp. N40(2020)]MBC8997662.1 hypothetical protein [Pseudomonas sp. N40(2020)]
MKALFTCMLLLGLLFSAACERVVTPDEYFASAQRVAEKIQRDADERIRREGAGEPELAYTPEQLRNAEGDFAALADNLKKASDGGHMLATYLLANLQDNPMFSERTRMEACGLYQKAMDQGLLAAAVGYYHLCDKAYERFDLQNADHLKFLQSLQQLLSKPDAYAHVYPLQAKRSLCFFDERAPAGQQGKLAAMRARAVALLLSEDQYRAEANYILALTRVNENDRHDGQNIAYLDNAEALGCKDYYGLSAMIRSEVKASAE